VAKKASEADPKPKQDPPGSEADPKGKVQDPPGSEDGNGTKQEPEKVTLKEARKQLLRDESFVNEVMGSEPVRAGIQSDRDTFASQQTIPLKQQMERLEAQLAEVTKAADPDMKEYERLKGEGDHEAALALLERKQAVISAESAASLRGKREGATEILSAIALREEFADLTQEDWRNVSAAAMAEAQAMGRSYMTADQYIAHAVRVVREKERANVGTASKEELETAAKEAVEAELKKRGLKSREEDGGPEDVDGGGGGGGTYTVEQIRKMSRAELAKIPRAERDKAMASS
jgi:hypothetical protein